MYNVKLKKNTNPRINIKTGQPIFKVVIPQNNQILKISPISKKITISNSGKRGLQGIPGQDGNNGNDGADGQEIELQKTSTHVQWRYVGGTWTNLIALVDITGPAGANGTNGTNGTNGVDGTDGTDGREIELQKGTTYIQWRYVGDIGWNNLVLVADLKGDQGDTGATGSPGPGIAPGGTTGQILKKKTDADYDTEWGSAGGAGDVLGPLTNTDNYIPQWNGANSKTLKDGLAVPAGGLAGLTDLSGKVDKVTGKGLSTEDYTTSEKSKLAGIEASANNYILPTASVSVLGGIKIGARLSIDGSGVLSADVQTTDISGKVDTSLFDANSMLYATTDNTPLALIIGEQTIVGRKTGGNISALTAAEVRTILNVADGAIAGATKALDNLASVAINTSLISDTDSTDDLGSSSKYWANGYIDKIYLNSTATLDGGTAGLVFASTKMAVGTNQSDKTLTVTGDGFAVYNTDNSKAFRARFGGATDFEVEGDLYFSVWSSAAYLGFGGTQYNMFILHANATDPISFERSIQLNGTNTISTGSNANLKLIPNGTGYTIIGDAGTTSHTFNTNDDLLVSGRLEVNGIAYLDSSLVMVNNQAITIADTTNVNAIDITQNDVTNNKKGMSITNAGTGNSLFVDANGNTSTSISAGGAVVIDNTGNTNGALNIYTKNDAPTRLVKFDVQPAYSTTVNGAQTIDTSSTSLTVASTTGFPASGTIRVMNATSTTENGDQVYIHYTSTDATHFIGTAGVFYKASTSINLINAAVVYYATSATAFSEVLIEDCSTNGGSVNLKLKGPNPDLEFIGVGGFYNSIGEGKYEFDLPVCDNVNRISTDVFRFNGRNDANSSFDPIIIFSRPGLVGQGMVGIGFQNKTSPVTLAAHLHIKNDDFLGDTNEDALVGLIVQGGDAQTADLIQAKNDAGGILASISAAGLITTGAGVVSDTDSTDDLGTSSVYWANTYTDKLYLNATATLDGASAGIVALTGRLNISGITQFQNSNATIEYTTDHMSINKGADGGVYLFEGATGVERPEFRIYGYGDSAGALGYSRVYQNNWNELMLDNVSGNKINIVSVMSTYTDIYVGSGQADSKAVIFGQGNDASIYYDGTNLVVNPKLVGTGHLSLLGDEVITGSGTTSASSALKIFKSDGTSYIANFRNNNTVAINAEADPDGWAILYVNGGLRVDDDWRFKKGSGAQYVTRSGGSGYDLVFQCSSDQITMHGSGGMTFHQAISALGSITLEENVSLNLDQSLSADGKYSGIAISGTSGDTLAFGDVIVLDPTAGKWLKADISAAANADGDCRGMIGICVLAANDTQTTKILLQGVIRADANFPALTTGLPVYASTTGDITTTQPTTTDHIIRILGFVVTDDLSATAPQSIYFNPSQDYITHT